MPLSESSPLSCTTQQSHQPATRTRKKRSNPEGEKISGYAEKIANDISGLIADMRASKRVRDSDSNVESGQDSTINSVGGVTRVSPEFHQYAEALTIVMAMYKEGRITREAVKVAVKELESNSIACVTFTVLLDEFREDWIDDIVKAQASPDSNVL